MRWLTKEIIEKINNFLTFNKHEGFIQIIDNYTSNIESFIEEEVNNAIEMSNDNIAAAKRHIVKLFFSLFHFDNSDSNTSNEKNIRDNDNFYIYNQKADYFRDFRISNFNTMMNDLKELKWFDDYSGLKGSAAKWRKNGHTLVKCAVVQTTNKKYMAANYNIIPDDKGMINYCSPSGYRQYSAAYNAKRTLGKFDSLYSSKLKNIRGFVRYTLEGKKHIFSFIKELSKDKPKYIKNHKKDKWKKIVSLDLFHFLYSISSFFVKDKCMKQEKEFRFLLIAKENNIKEIIIDEEPAFYIQTTYEYKDLIKNVNNWYC